MSTRIQKQDYYFGVALSSLFNNNCDATLTLLENGSSSREFRMTTNTSSEFILYMKYASKASVQGREKTWRFSITDSERQKIGHFIHNEERLFVILICGDKDLKTGDIAVLTTAEFNQLSGKTGISVKVTGPNAKVFHIQGIKKPVQRNRIEKRLTDL